MVESHSDALLVPQEAVRREGKQAFVMVVRAGKAHRVPVTTGLRNNGWVEIVSGLSPSDSVILEGLQQVQEGTLVRVVE